MGRAHVKSDPSGVEPFPTYLLPNLYRALQETDGSYDVATIENMIAEGLVQLWARYESFVLTELKVAPTGKKYLHIFLCAGAMPDLDLRGLYPVLEEFARREQCCMMTMIGRKGWERTFLTKDEGWTVPYSVYRKELV